MPPARESFRSSLSTRRSFTRRLVERRRINVFFLITFNRSGRRGDTDSPCPPLHGLAPPWRASCGEANNSAQLALRCHFLLLTPARGRHHVPMNSPAFGLRVASAIFALFAVAHVVRLVEQAQVTVGTHQIPMSLSVVALIIAAILSIWLWRLSSARP